jgi:hypothetical protein
MRATSKANGPEWCPPTRELDDQQLLKLVGRTRNATGELEAEPPPAGIALLRDSAAPLENVLFTESSSIALTADDLVEDFSKPVTIEPTASRFKLEPKLLELQASDASAVQPIAKAPSKRPELRPVYPVYRSAAVRALRVFLVLLFLGALGVLGAGAVVTFGI